MEKRLEYLEEQFRYYYSNLNEASSFFYQIDNGDYEYDPTNYDDANNLQYAEYWTHQYIQRMYNIVCVYFETLSLHEYLRDFKAEFGERVKKEEDAIKRGSTLLKYGDSTDDLAIIIEWRRVLAPFNLLKSKELKEKNRKLIGLLESTNEILKLTNAVVYKEEDINDPIRRIAALYFNGVISFADGYFAHKFKKYRPDVIIGELDTAVEYKLVRDDNEIGIKLDELHTDAIRYTGNANNKYCIAVFCLSKEVKKTKKEIKEDWNGTGFPGNWELIIINDVAIQTKKVTSKHQKSKKVPLTS